jgi:3-mercaptopyruvate sulfurtransferase SseA
MRLLYSLSAAAVLAVLTFAACNSTDTKGNRAGSNSNTATTQSPSPGHIAPADGVKRVTTVEVRDAVANGTAVVFDVRSAVAYQQSHIKGSINVPVEQVEARVKDFPRDKMIITYCS